jgi:hypothetical protein
MGADAVVPDRGYVVSDTDVRQIAEWDVERYKRHAEYENQDHPHPLPGQIADAS